MKERLFIVTLGLAAVIALVVGVDVVSKYIKRDVQRLEREHREMHEKHPELPHR